MRPLPASLLLPLLLAPCFAQREPTATAPKPPAANEPAAPHFVVRRYPQDRDAPVAIVGDRTLTLGDLVDHLDRRHQPGFRARLEAGPEYQRMLQSDLIAPWVRHFADLEALRQTFGDRIDATKLEQAQSDAL